MTNKDQTQVLNETILYMQNKQATELYLLKEQFHITLESLKPINLLKSTVKKSKESPEIKKKINNNNPKKIIPIIHEFNTFFSIYLKT